MLRRATKVMTGALFACATMLASGSAFAAELCSVLPDTTTNTDGLSTSDVTFRTNDADDCYGIGSGQPTITDINAVGWGTFSTSVKDEGAPGSVTFLGLTWTLSAPNNVSTGEWTLTVADAPEAGTFPVTVDLVAVLKGSNSWAAYLFTAELFSVAGSNPGTFNIVFRTSGPTSPIPDLSNMQVFLRGATTTVPEPGTLLMLGIGAALAASRRVQRRGQLASLQA